MIQIAYVVEKFPSQTEHFVLNEILALEKRNFKIYIIALKKPKYVLNIPELEYLNASIIYLPNLINYLLLILFKNYKENLRFFRSSCSEYWPNIKIILKNLRYLIIAQYFTKKLKKIGISHVHAHFAFYTTDIAYLISKLLKLNYSFTAHAQDIFLNKENIVKKIEKASFVITCTKYNQSFLNQLTGNRYCNKIYHAYHGVNLNNELATIHHQNIFTNGTIHILSVARLVEKKGIIYLLKAVKMLLNKGIKIKCTIIGDGPLSKKLKFFTLTEGISNYVEFKGINTREEVFNYLTITDIFVLPCIIASDGDRDGLPNVLLEAMMMGVPVITTNISAIPELIEDGKTGLLVPERDEIAIVDAVLKLFNDSVLYREIVKKGREKVVKNFNIQKSIDIIEELLINNIDTDKNYN
jgi:glycosyltransferase involved in cell wall biosynthesis